MSDRLDFASKADLAEALATAVVADLTAGIAARGIASLCVSGGSTPKLLFQSLANYDGLDWSKVTVTLVDERWVDANSDRSNAKLVKDNLLQNHAASASFVPLYGGGGAPDMARVASLNNALMKVPQPFDAVILGMGNDGHTASFFPGSDNLQQALTDVGPTVAITAPDAGEPRITWTLPRLLDTESLYLHIESAQKAETLSRARADGRIAEMPVRAVLRQHLKPVHIYWCP